MASCQPGMGTTPATPDNNVMKDTIVESNTHRDAFCDYFYSKDALRDTLHFDFGKMEDFGPVRLSEPELKQIYSEIKRGNVDAYSILFTHYFYTYSHIPKAEMDKLICITDFLAQEYSYHRGYLMCANFLFDQLKYNTKDHYTTTIITYYEKYFDSSKSESVARKLYDIYCGNYSFQDKDSVKAKYYEEFLSDK